MNKVEAAMVSTGPAATANNTEYNFWMASSALDEQSPLPLDNSEGGLFAAGFVPPPPRPIFLDDSATPDGLTTCDLCTWAWQNKNAGTLYGFDAMREIPGELGWVLTLVIVSLTSAIIGAVVMIVLLHCKRLKTSNSNEPENVISLSQGVVLSQQPTTDASINKDISTNTPTNLPNVPSVCGTNNGVWSWLARRTDSSPTQLTLPSALPVENHYTHMEDGYNSVAEGLYAELDQESTVGISNRANDDNPAYQNSAYTDPDAPTSSAPSSAYYSDLSTTAVQERAYEIVGLNSLTNWELNYGASDSRKPAHRLAAISENVNVPSDYV